MKSSIFTLFISLSFVLGTVLIPAKALPAQVSDQPEPAIPEEIIVNAPESLRLLRIEIDNARESMFNVFNEFNDDDKFDVHCDYVRRWQSKIREQVCTPVFYDTAREQEANLLLDQLGYIGAQRGQPGITQIHHYSQEFEEKIREIFANHPEFREAIAEFESLEEYLEAVRNARFDKN